MKNNISGSARPYQNLHSLSIAKWNQFFAWPSAATTSVPCGTLSPECSKMAEWRKFAAKQKAKRRGKNQVLEDNKVAEEIVVQRMSGDVSGKQQKYSRIGAQEYVPFEQDELSIRSIKDACQKYFGPQIEKDLVCDVLAGQRGPSCNKMAQIPNKKVFYVRFVKPEGELRRGTWWGRRESQPWGKRFNNNKWMLSSSVARTYQ